MSRRILVLGVGNLLMTDDGVGLHVIAALHQSDALSLQRQSVTIRDGGTIGLALLPEIEAAQALVVVDAANFGGAPGEVRVFDADGMDAQIGSIKSSVHELALADLVGAALLNGALPQRRALVGIVPREVGWGLELTPEVAASVPLACARIEEIVERWTA